MGTQWEELRDEWQTLCDDSAVQAAWNAALEGLDKYVMQSSNPMTEAANPWVGRVCSDLGHFFGSWLTFLPNTTDGLMYIQELNYLFAEKFNRGTAISCVLMPNNYHRLHSP